MPYSVKFWLQLKQKYIGTCRKLLSLVGCCLATKSLNRITQSGISGDNACGSELLGATSNEKVIFSRQNSANSPDGTAYTL